jgi:xylulose-5-phosphate/fructose-6-phosphate phosphoketolase
MRKTMRTATVSEPSVMDRAAISPDDLDALDACRRAANDLGAARVYLRDDVLLEEPFRPAHITPRLLGHWGTIPGINFLYAHLNRLIRAYGADVLLVTGPGHGAPANLANLFLEGSLGEFDPRPRRDRAGLEWFVRGFSQVDRG